MLYKHDRGFMDPVSYVATKIKTLKGLKHNAAYEQLKRRIISDDERAPYLWLEGTMKGYVQGYKARHASFLAQTVEHAFQHSNPQLSRFYLEMPYAMHLTLAAENKDALVISQNYLYKNIPSPAPQTVDTELKKIALLKGYAILCHESAALRYIWETLFATSTALSMQEALTRAQSSRALNENRQELQETLALNLTRIDRAQRFSQSDQELDNELEKLARFLEQHFDPVFSMLAEGSARHTHALCSLRTVRNNRTLIYHMALSASWLVPRCIYYLNRRDQAQWSMIKGI